MSEEDLREIEALSSKFEAVKIAMTQDKNGHVLKLSIHPNDTPEDLMRDLVGTRYLIVAVRMDDENKPVMTPQMHEGQLAVKSAATLAKDERFQSWLCQIGEAQELSEEAAANAIRKIAGIKSRGELKTSSDARKRFLAFRDEFSEHLRRGNLHPRR